MIACVTVTEAQTCVAPSPGLIGWWPGDSNSSDIAGGHPGTLQGGTIFVPGMVAGAFSFNGVDGYIQTFAAQADTAALTYEAWVKTTAPEGIIISAGDADNRDGWATDLGFAVAAESAQLGLPDGVISFYVNDSSTTTYPHVFTTATYNDGQWHHVVAVFQNTGGTAQDDLAIYVDGVKVPHVALPQNPYSSATTVGFNSLRIGRSDRLNPAEARPFSGEIDEVSIYSRALSSSEIAALFNAGQAGKC